MSTETKRRSWERPFFDQRKRVSLWLLEEEHRRFAEECAKVDRPMTGVLRDAVLLMLGDNRDD